ncbi:hypothetical protein U8527_16255 [Kordia algicida OT-1]|uniref:Uncharacterized protein n=1 Tax=Kordia algicida OT-1 TaxID=391587 RepID=A9ECE8_9FLAO|nr:hypothetical protein [Kordia algicida]EDP94353.1 hypothetical protein KAOT1_09901 [Kordia algicida OT-1]
MKYTKPTYLAFFITAFVALIIALFFDKLDLLYIYPFCFITIAIIYIQEKKESLNFLFPLALIVGLAGGVLIIIGLGQCVPEVSVCISLFYLLYIRLMYIKNEKQKTTVRTYIILLFILLPILYVYDRVMCLVYDEIREDFIYFAVMVVLMLTYIMFALYYYIRNKNQANLWMLIAAVNLAIMNIIITINELYVYERMFTVLAVFCSNLMLFFSLKFMLEDEKNTLNDFS